MGVLQAQVTDDGARVLLKLDAPLLFEALALGEPTAYTADALTTPEAHTRTLRYLALHLRVEGGLGLCERDEVELLQLTPSRAFVDVIMRFHCARPRGFIRVTTTALLDEPGHFLKGTFAQGEAITHRSLKRAAPDFTFTLDDPPLAPSPPAPAPPPPPGWPWLALGLLGLLPLLTAAPHRQRLLGAGLAAGGGLCAALAAPALGLEAWSLPLGLLGAPVAALAALGLILERLPTSRAASAALWLLGGAAAGLLVGAQGGPPGWSWALAGLAPLLLAAGALARPLPQGWRRALGAAAVMLSVAALLGALASTVGAVASW